MSAESNEKYDSPRDNEFRALLAKKLDGFSDADKDNARKFVSEKPVYKEMLAKKILMDAEQVGGLHTMGLMAAWAKDVGIDKEYMIEQLTNSFSGYWEESKRM